MSDKKKLTAHQIEVLGALVAHDSMVPGDWARPMDLGGSDASWHSGVLRRLAARGLVEQKGGRLFFRAAWRYRITRAGRKAWAGAK